MRLLIPTHLHPESQAEAMPYGNILWQPTAGENQFTASLKGKYNVVTGTDDDGPWIRMTYLLIWKDWRDGEIMEAVRLSHFIACGRERNAYAGMGSGEPSIADLT